MGLHGLLSFKGQKETPITTRGGTQGFLALGFTRWFLSGYLLSRGNLEHCSGDHLPGQEVGVQVGLLRLRAVPGIEAHGAVAGRHRGLGVHADAGVPLDSGGQLRGGAGRLNDSSGRILGFPLFGF